MRRGKQLLHQIFMIFALAFFSGCATSKVAEVEKEIDQIIIQHRLEAQAEAGEKMAMESFRRGGFAQCAKAFGEISDLYQQKGVEEKAKKALIAKAKCQLWAGNRADFAKTMEEVKRFSTKYDIPEDDVQLLVNLLDATNHRPPTYPIPGMELIFE